MGFDYRSVFDIPREICYLKAAYVGPQPRCVVDAALDGARRRSQPWQIAPIDFFREVEELRSAFARLMACSPENIAIVPSASYGTAVAARNLPVASGDAVLMLEDQFPSNYYPWKRAVDAVGGSIAFARPAPGQDWTTAVLAKIDALGDRIAVATLEQHHWQSGEAIDVQRLCDELRRCNASIVLDLTQTAGICPVDVAALDPDYIVVAGYKWLFCPYGLSFLYVADRKLDGTPIEEAWASRFGSEDFSQLSDYTDQYQSGARRYDMGQRASFSNVAAGVAALNLLNEWGVENISRSVAQTSDRITAMLDQFGFSTVDRNLRGPHIQSARPSSGDARELAAALGEQQVFVSHRGQDLRFAPHVYNDAQDLDRLQEVLTRLL